MTKKEDGPLIATDRAKWDPAYQRKVGLKTGAAKLPDKTRQHLEQLSRRIYGLLGSAATRASTTA